MTAVERVGRSAIGGAEDAGRLTLQLWRVLLTLPRALSVVGRRRRWRAAVQQMLSIGAEAMPMAGTMCFCVGYVLALQSAAELRRFGACTSSSTWWPSRSPENWGRSSPRLP
jgi:ABC-type transporter Mla maintaining outer membrane lipid asymmetry permease subunit MlaE